MPEIWETHPPLSKDVAQSGVADESGALAYSGVSSSSTAGEIAFQGPTADFILYGVVNGAFAQGPPFSDENIDPQNNPLPYWYGPISVSGGAITASWVTDASSPSGKNLLFTINPGAASDEAYFEQIVPIGGAREQAFAHAARATTFRTSATSVTFQSYVSLQYLTAAGATTGSTVSDTKSLTVSGVFTPFAEMQTPPADAYYARVRFGVKRGVAAATDSGGINVSNIRLEKQMGRLRLPEENLSTQSIATFFQNAASVWLKFTGSSFNIQRTADGVNKQFAVDLDASGGRSIYLGDGATAADVRIFRAAADVLATDDTFRMTEAAAPGTPAAGTVYLYAKTDGKFYSKDDAGTETALAGGGSSWDATITKSANQSKTNNTLVADSELFAALSAGNYEMEIALIYSNAAGGAPDFKVELGEDATGRSVLSATGVSDAEVDQVIGQRCRTGITTTWGTTVADRVVFFKGIYISAGGTFQVSWAQNTTNATATIVKANSFLRYKAL